MSTDEYRRALDAAIGEYETLGARRQEIDKRLTELAQTISTLSRLCGLTPTVPWGLTDACRVVLRSGRPMTPTDVRDRLLSIGFDLSKYSSELAAIHTVSNPRALCHRRRCLPPRAGGVGARGSRTRCGG